MPQVIRQWLMPLLLLLALLSAVPAGAHFLLNLNVRIFHVDHRADGLVVYARMPMTAQLISITAYRKTRRAGFMR